MADWSKEKLNFLDVEVTPKKGVLSTDLFVKPADTSIFRSYFLPSLSL